MTRARSASSEVKRGGLGTVARKLIAAMAMLAAIIFIAACGDDSSSSDTTASDPAGAPIDVVKNVSAGAEIPDTSFSFGMAPFADASFYVIGIRQGWFDDVGITLTPEPDGTEITPDNVVQKMVSGAAEVATFYGPGRIQTLAQEQDIKMFGFSDTFVGNYILAPPDADVDLVSDLVDGGMDFEEAVATAVEPMQGSSFAFTNTGQRRDFLETVFDVGGVSFDDLDATAANDARILALAKGGQADFVSPEGASQNVELLNDGWQVVIGAEDLLAGLPAGDPRSVAPIGHEGPAASQEWLDENHESALRFLSVMFRIIDAIEADPDKYLADQAPYITARSGVKTAPQDLETIFNTIDPLVPFEDQTQFWTDLKGPMSYESVYSAQIKSATEAGILPEDGDFSPDDAIVGKQFYDELVALKEAYDELLPDADGLSGESAELAEEAAAQYEARNYLDAYRQLKTAVDG